MNDVVDAPSAAPGTEDAFSVARHPCPFPGLRPYRQHERDLFFGRDKQIQEIIERLCTHRFAVVLGGSGCGKSSLILAGLISDLRLYAVPGRSDTWVPVVFTPGDRPVNRFAEALHKQLTASRGQQDVRDIEGMLEQPRTAEDPGAIEEFLQKYQDRLQIDDKPLTGFGDQASLLIVVDQFEEVFHEQALEEQANKLVELLIHAYDRRNERIYVVLTMRSEYLDRCAGYDRLPDILNEVFYITRKLKREELEEVIVKPARRWFAKKWFKPGEKYPPHPWPFDEEVKERVLSEVEAIAKDADHLPLLQHLLFWLWAVACQRWGSDRNTHSRITRQDLDAAVGDGAIPAEAPVTPAESPVWYARVASAVTLLLQPARSSAECVADGPPDARQTSMLRRCLEFHADQLFAKQKLRPQGEKIAKSLFVRLAEADDRGMYKRRWTNRLAVARAAGDVPDAEVESTVRLFREPHPYLRYRGSEDMKDLIDVSHESFIRNWPRFCTWLDHERDGGKVCATILEQYLQWRKKRSDAGKLIRAWIWLTDLIGPNTRKKAQASKVDVKGILTDWADGERLPAEMKRRSVQPQDCREAIAYYTRSRRLRIGWLALGGVVGGFIVLGSGIFLILRDQERLASLEARAYTASTIAASVAQSRGSLDSDQNASHLRQTAVSLNILDHLEKDAPAWEAGEKGLKFEAARRFAFKSVDTALNGIGRSSLWPTPDQPEGKYSEAQQQNDPECIQQLLNGTSSSMGEERLHKDRLYQGGNSLDGGVFPLLLVRHLDTNTWFYPGWRQDRNGRCARRLEQEPIKLQKLAQVWIHSDLESIVGLVDPSQTGETAPTYFVQRLRWYFGKNSLELMGDAPKWLKMKSENAETEPRLQVSKDNTICIEGQCYWIPTFDWPRKIDKPNDINFEHDLSCPTDPAINQLCLSKEKDRIVAAANTQLTIAEIPPSDNSEIVDFQLISSYGVPAQTDQYYVMAYQPKNAGADGVQDTSAESKTTIAVFRIPKKKLQECQEYCDSVATVSGTGILTFTPKVPPIDKIVARQVESGDIKLFIRSNLGGAMSYYEILYGMKRAKDKICHALHSVVQSDARPDADKWTTSSYRTLQKLAKGNQSWWTDWMPGSGSGIEGFDVDPCPQPGAPEQ